MILSSTRACTPGMWPKMPRKLDLGGKAVRPR
jgi:hypothetical protein